MNYELTMAAVVVVGLLCILGWRYNQYRLENNDYAELIKKRKSADLRKMGYLDFLAKDIPIQKNTRERR
jgi:hypothetical protein